MKIDVWKSMKMNYELPGFAQFLLKKAIALDRVNKQSSRRNPETNTDLLPLRVWLKLFKQINF